MSRKTGPQCLVCNKTEGVSFDLPSGKRIMLCVKCQNDRWQLEAAERKAELRDKEETPT